MILFRNHINKIIFSFLLLSLYYSQPVYGQKNELSEPSLIKENFSSRQDTASELRKRNALMAEPDTNFTWEKYAIFLKKISDTSKYVVLPLNEFRKTFNTNKIIIGLRHDLDNDLNVGFAFSEIESSLGFRSTYYILHTAPYYLANSNNMGIHSESIIPVLKTMQNERHFEIGWHNDLVTLQLIYNINPVTFLTNELAWLRSNGINIIGTAAHGSNYCKVYHYMNFYFFEECTYPVVPLREYNISVPIWGVTIPIIKGKLSDFNLEYEAYFLNNNKAFSDATITNGIRWDIGMLDLNQLQKGDRVIILLHPIHWHKASVNAGIESFRIDGQKSVAINYTNSTVNVEMPYGTNRNFLQAIYSLSAGAYAKVSGKLQVAGSTKNNFSAPVTYRVFAENRDITRDWIVNVFNSKNSAADFEWLQIPEVTKSVFINKVNKTITVELKEGADITHLPLLFALSDGAKAWINEVEQFSNSGTFDFTGSLVFRVSAEDGVSSNKWTITVRISPKYANFISFTVPGLIGQVKIDTLNNTIYAEVDAGTPVTSLMPSFLLSSQAKAFVGKQEQISGISTVDFSAPVLYEIVSKDSLKIKKWKVIVHQTPLAIKAAETTRPGLLIYPNPSDGIIHLQFNIVKASPVKLEIFNSLGDAIYTETISKSGSFNVDADLSKFPSGVYYVKYSDFERPLILVLQ